MKLISGDRLRLIIIVLVLSAGLLLLLGAGGNTQVGRYQMNLGGGANPVIVDTTTGQWKMFDITTGQVKQSGQW